MGMIMRLLVMVGVMVIVWFCRTGFMRMVVGCAVAAMAVIVTVFESVSMVVVVMVGMAVFLVAMLVRMFMLVLMFVGMGMFVGMFTVAHLRSPDILLD